MRITAQLARLGAAFLLVGALAACVTSQTPVSPPATSKLTSVISGDLAPLSVGKGRYAWHPSLFVAHVADGENEDAVLWAARQAIVEVMADKGYEQVDLNEAPDFLLGFGVAMASKMDDETILKHVGLSAGLSDSGVDQARFEKGSVLVALFRPLTPSEPFWRHLAQGWADNQRNEAEAKARFSRVIETMLAPIPAHER